MYEYKVVEVVRIVDGDTYDLRISLGFGMTAALRFRLKDYDAPEMYGRDAVPEGKKARDFVVSWCESRNLAITTYKGSGETIGLGDGAFGRWLCDVWDRDTGESLIDAMPPK